jgi:hypothetical protein
MLTARRWRCAEGRRHPPASPEGILAHDLARTRQRKLDRPGGKGAQFPVLAGDGQHHARGVAAVAVRLRVVGFHNRQISAAAGKQPRPAKSVSLTKARHLPTRKR